MREFKLAERLLSLFSSPDSAAGIVGDLNEERGPRGSLWFWRQVLGTMRSLCRGVLFESPLVVVPLVVAGFVLLEANNWGLIYGGIYLLKAFSPMVVSPKVFMTLATLPLYWLGALLVGMSFVTASQRRGMVACALLAALVLMRSTLSAGIGAFAHDFPFRALSTVWLTMGLGTSTFLLLGGALIRRRQNLKLPRTA